MAKFKIVSAAICPFEDGENRGKHYFPGDVVDLDEKNPQTLEWLKVGVIEAVREAVKVKAEPKPKAKEGE